MERLLLLRLRSVGVAAEARLNDIAVARTPATGGEVCLPVHEYLLEGPNRLTLVGAAARPGQPPQPLLPKAPLTARASLLLPRLGRAASEDDARRLTAIDWAHEADEPLLEPVLKHADVTLPIRFPRWRWLDLPRLDLGAPVQVAVAGFVQTLAISLARGDADAFARAARLRFEELAVAYEQPLPELIERWRSRIRLLHVTQALKLQLPALTDVRLVPCAEGRLVECVAPDGDPVLRTEAAPDGSRQFWPLRVAVVDGRCHVLR